MALEITGKVIQILPLETGEGKNGQWKKQFFIMEYMDGNYPKKLSVSVWGDKTESIRNLQPGANIKVSFNVDSREYNGRWYTDVRAWKIETGGAASAPSNDTPSFDEPAMSDSNGFNGAPDNNDLPF
ncbi:MAG: DUF3127 domain-containing protein [Bacteroidetes bacterium]|nr:DUF3127 domain-containing protein [Bacteroidota bacterium]MBK9047205.1 DUF3127 domain-containing protein [Bacteroidota bacterium]